MRTRVMWFRDGLAAVLVLGSLVGTAWTQRSGTQQQPQPMQPLGIPSGRIDPRAAPEEAAMRNAEEKQGRMRNDERQKRLVLDTEKLLQLATQLHNDVAKTDKNVLSLDVIRRAEEIERLAHGVKDRMKG